MNVQSLKTISQSSLNLERTQILKLGGGHLKNKISHRIFFSKVVPLTPKINKKN